MDKKKPVLIFTVCDANNFKFAVPFIKSLTKFHSPKDIDIMCITSYDHKLASAQLPDGIILEDLTPYTKDDPYFFYRQKPIVAEKYLDEYEVVIGMDCDQLVLGDLSYIWKTQGYDVATVVNWNRIDFQIYGYVDLGRIGIAPAEYFNCGLVAFRSKKFAHHWTVLCFSDQFMRVQFREQDILNVLCYYGNYNVRCLDHQDTLAGMNAWWGLISKGEWGRAVVKEGKIIIPKGEGNTPFPPVDTELKVIHKGGGGNEPKDNWGAYFSDDVMKRIGELIK